MVTIRIKNNTMNNIIKYKIKQYSNNKTNQGHININRKTINKKNFIMRLTITSKIIKLLTNNIFKTKNYNKWTNSNKNNIHYIFYILKIIILMVSNKLNIIYMCKNNKLIINCITLLCFKNKELKININMK